MRRINKQVPLPDFNGVKFKDNCRSWEDFHRDHKAIFEDIRLKILMDEQNQLCGYTEIYINELEECHVDHYMKRSMYPQLTFDWNNLIVATKDSKFGANYKDNLSGLQKNEYADIFNPVIDNIENYFEYTIWGEVIPKKTISDDKSKKAEKTIKVFNLNHNSLKDRRKRLIKMIDSYKNVMTSRDILPALNNSGFISLINERLK